METCKILIIDKNEKYAQGLSNLLREEGYQTSCVNSFQAGIKSLKNDFFDLVITEADFKDIVRESLIPQLEKSMKKKTPILVLSEQDDAEEIEDFLRQGISDYIIKPPRISYLLKRIESLISSGN
jgi:DNA-binding response OmpR family regulator